MPKHLDKKIAEIKEYLRLLEAEHKDETKAVKAVEKAHAKEGKKVHAKRMGPAGKEKLKDLHAKEGEALEAVMKAHKEETSTIRMVKSAVSGRAPRMTVKAKAKPADVMKSAEAKPEAKMMIVAPPMPEKRKPGRPKMLKAAQSAEMPAPPVERVAPKLKLEAVVEPGMAPAALAGGAPETGPQESAKPKKGRGRPKKVKVEPPKMVVEVEEKPKKERKARKPMTEEQKAAAKERMAHARSMRGKGKAKEEDEKKKV